MGRGIQITGAGAAFCNIAFELVILVRVKVGPLSIGGRRQRR
jgi:hypothetical protein